MNMNHFKYRRQAAKRGVTKEVEVVDLSVLSWPDLRAMAKAAGINTFRMDRKQVEAALSE